MNFSYLLYSFLFQEPVFIKSSTPLPSVEPALSASSHVATVTTSMTTHSGNRSFATTAATTVSGNKSSDGSKHSEGNSPENANRSNSSNRLDTLCEITASARHSNAQVIKSSNSHHHQHRLDRHYQSVRSTAYHEEGTRSDGSSYETNVAKCLFEVTLQNHSFSYVFSVTYRHALILNFQFHAERVLKAQFLSSFQNALCPEGQQYQAQWQQQKFSSCHFLLGVVSASRLISILAPITARGQSFGDQSQKSNERVGRSCNFLASHRVRPGPKGQGFEQPLVSVSDVQFFDICDGSAALQ